MTTPSRPVSPRDSSTPEPEMSRARRLESEGEDAVHDAILRALDRYLRRQPPAAPLSRPN